VTPKRLLKTPPWMGRLSPISWTQVIMRSNVRRRETNKSAQPSDVLGLTPFRGHRLSGLGGRGDELVFKRYWADLAERAVPSPAVVDRLDP